MDFYSQAGFTAQFQWWLFDDPSFSTSNSGLELYDQTGKLIFTASQAALRIVGVIGTEHSNYPAGFTGPAGRKYATITGINARGAGPDPAGTNYSMRSAYGSLNAPSAGWEGGIILPTSSGNQKFNATFCFGVALVVDVTSL